MRFIEPKPIRSKIYLKLRYTRQRTVANTLCEASSRCCYGCTFTNICIMASDLCPSSGNGIDRQYIFINSQGSLLSNDLNVILGDLHPELIGIYRGRNIVPGNKITVQCQYCDNHAQYDKRYRLTHTHILIYKMLFERQRSLLTSSHL